VHSGRVVAGARRLEGTVLSLDRARVVITGGTGFLGSHVARHLTLRGADVVALGSADYDLRERAEITAMLHSLHPHAVIHLAAIVGGIGANQAAPGRFFYENALMGIELLEACRVQQVPKLVIAGTVCGYPRLAPVPFRERDLWSGYPETTNAAYGLAKRMLLVQAQAYRQQYGCNFVYLLPTNLYGPGDHDDLETSHVIPAMIRKFSTARDAGEPTVRLWGDGTPTRDFLHVEDAARAFGLALERYDGPEPVNVGSGVEISIGELAELVRQLIGFEGAIEWEADRPNGQPRRLLETTRAREAFGFEATVPLRAGLESTIASMVGA
jgi:GDP-L-fucose synthase